MSEPSVAINVGFFVDLSLKINYLSILMANLMSKIDRKRSRKTHTVNQFGRFIVKFCNLIRFSSMFIVVLAQRIYKTVFKGGLCIDQ